MKLIRFQDKITKRSTVPFMVCLGLVSVYEVLGFSHKQSLQISEILNACQVSVLAFSRCFSDKGCNKNIFQSHAAVAKFMLSHIFAFNYVPVFRLLIYPFDLDILI